MMDVVRRLLEIFVRSEAEVAVFQLGRGVDPAAFVPAERPFFVVAGDDVLAQLGADRFEPVAQVADDGKIAQDGVARCRRSCAATAARITRTVKIDSHDRGRGGNRPPCQVSSERWHGAGSCAALRCRSTSSRRRGRPRRARWRGRSGVPVPGAGSPGCLRRCRIRSSSHFRTRTRYCRMVSFSSAIEAQHLFRLFGYLDRLDVGRGGATEIVNVLRDGQRVGQFLARVLFQLLRD